MLFYPIYFHFHEYENAFEVQFEILIPILACTFDERVNAYIRQFVNIVHPFWLAYGSCNDNTFEAGTKDQVACGAWTMPQVSQHFM